jgi:hypothetical protein
MQVIDKFKPNKNTADIIQFVDGENMSQREVHLNNVHGDEK